MKKFVFPLAALLVVVLIAWWTFDLLQKVNDPIEEAVETQDIPSVQQPKETTVEYGDYVYIGGEDGLAVGDKRQPSFQQYITENKVQNISLNDRFLQYEEWNTETNIWEVKNLNLEAYSQYLNSPQ